MLSTILANGTKSHDGDPWITGVQYRDPQLSDGYQTSCHRGPQAHKKQNARDGPYDVRRDGRNLWLCPRVCNPTMKQRCAGKETLEQQASAGPTAGESRK